MLKAEKPLRDSSRELPSWECMIGSLCEVAVGQSITEPQLQGTEGLAREGTENVTLYVSLHILSIILAFIQLTLPVL